MQWDPRFAKKFDSIINVGIIKYLKERHTGNLEDDLSLFMVPGDLVVTGGNPNDWRRTFFEPASKLLGHVPVYAVMGNHEILGGGAKNSYFFKYFKLPENGTPGFEEHWWYKDYNNVRIIGLDTNFPYDNQRQLNWLDELLSNTCKVDSIDFVFAQLHHPHKSELWRVPQAESDFTKEVVHKLEQFSSRCKKPSIHFFGHAHGYSRGQSRDHKHLWINVASGGGALDNWNKPFDYDQFSVSMNEFGFVIVEITNEQNPKIVMKRISIGNETHPINNTITDSLTMGVKTGKINTPYPISPKSKKVNPNCVTLKASAFTSPRIDAEHGQSHWQISSKPNDFSNPVKQSWKNFENWFKGENSQDGDDLTNESIVQLKPSRTYHWRVRYRDKQMNWSKWSISASFKTGKPLKNLLKNSGAEENLKYWSITQGVSESLQKKQYYSVPAYSGKRYFAVGGVYTTSNETVSKMVQDVDVQPYANQIDREILTANYGGYLSNYAGDDLPEVKIIFLDDKKRLLGESNVLSTENNAWTMLSGWTQIPKHTRTIRIELKGTKVKNSDSDCYFDDMFLRIHPNHSHCAKRTKPITIQPNYIPKMNIDPNPTTKNGTTITIPNYATNDKSVPIPKFKIVAYTLPKIGTAGTYTKYQAYKGKPSETIQSILNRFTVNILDMNGDKVVPSYGKDCFYLAPKNYFIWIRGDKGKIIASGRIRLRD